MPPERSDAVANALEAERTVPIRATLWRNPWTFIGNGHDDLGHIG